jgi:DNA-binding XRE family transcriptional regulator
MTQQQLAWAVQRDRSTISKIEAGRLLPSFRLAYRIASCLDSTLEAMTATRTGAGVLR